MAPAPVPAFRQIEMLPKVLSRWSGKTPLGTPTVPASPAGAAPVARPTPLASAAIASSKAPAPLLTEPSIQDEVEAGSDVRRTLRTVLANLEPTLDAVDRRGDALELFDKLAKSGEKTVRQPPAAAQRALELLRKDVAIVELVKLVEQDPSLAQALLRHANSAALGTTTTITSLGEGIRRVGTQGLRSVILGSMVDGMLCRPGAQYDGMVKQVWEHMVRTAPIARAIAPAFNVLPDEAFTLALLHDVGKLVLFDRLGTLRTELRRDLRLSQSLVPRLLKELHEVLGAAAALRWGLGKGAVAAIGDHHRTSDPLLVSPHSECVHVAERIDLAQVRGRPIALDEWCLAGRLTVPAAAISTLIPVAS
jgi:HD-like signal output (HDOD) protein